ncbi:MAG: hypothetical protein ACOYT4_03905 [Nanoarchaeota archaeon]
MKIKILYIEDMKECYEKTLAILKDKCEIDWKKTPLEAIWAIFDNRLKEYDLAIFDVNLTYDARRKIEELPREGLELIAMAKKRLKELKSDLRILCVSKGNYKEEALKKGANAYYWKREFWEGKGLEEIERILK